MPARPPAPPSLPSSESPALPVSGPSRRTFLAAAGAAAAAASLCPPALLAAVAIAEPPPAAEATLRIATGKPINAFDPDQALGSSMDELSPQTAAKIYTPAIVKASLSAGWGPISYRNHTELAIEAWHWNPEGAWSDAADDPAHPRGYFTGNARPSARPITRSYGYPLPRRGTTRDGGASRGYSRMTDGDSTTFWKSNPYLTQRYTHEPDSRHPQWVILDLGAELPVNALRIDWCEPRATRFEVQYWTGGDPMSWEAQYSPGGAGVASQANGRWNAFPQGLIANGAPGSVLLRLIAEPLPVRWLRILMTESSGLACPEANPDGDPRDRCGYAIHQLYAGLINPDGTFLDYVTHTPDQNQSVTYASSTDSWHRASDLETRRDQTGMDLFFTSGITNHLPAMIPVAVLYGTPENAAAQVAYLRARGYAVGHIEMGEECDGQYCMPEDYAALYMQVAQAAHQAWPGLPLGGPVFQGINQDITVWPDAEGRSSWFNRFLDYLRVHRRLQELAFVSFEHYPFDPCNITWADLFREPELTRSCLESFRTDGLPAGVPLMITESNLSWNMTEYMSEIFSGLWLADSVGSFFQYGGSAYYHSPIQPQPPSRGCHGWATWSNFVCDRDFKITGYTAEYYASHLINLEWVKHGAGRHRMFAVNGTVTDAAGHRLVTTYALRQPSGEWALMIVNKDPDNAHAVRAAFQLPSGRVAAFRGPVRMATFGKKQYVWHGDGPHAHADPDLPPVVRSLPGGHAAVYRLPPASVTVLRGRIG